MLIVARSSLEGGLGLCLGRLSTCISSRVGPGSRKFAMTYNVQGFFSLNRIEQLCDAG
jgi:hypothetical protein